MDNIQRLVKRTPTIDPVELEMSRSRVLERLSVIDDARRAGSVVDEPVIELASGSDRGPTDQGIDGSRQTGSEVEVIASRDALAEEVASRPTVVDDEPADLDDDMTPLMMVLGTRRRPTATGSAQPGLFDVPEISDSADGSVDLPADRSPDDGSAVDSDAIAAFLAETGHASDTAPMPAAGATSVAAIAVASVAVAYCPSCATVLDPPPTATRRCLQCRQKIVVVQVDERTVYLAESALPVFEAQRRRLAALEEWRVVRDRWLELAAMSGATPSKIGRIATEPPSEQKAAAARALYMSAVDRAFAHAANDARWEDAAQIRYDEAVVLFEFAGASRPLVEA